MSKRTFPVHRGHWLHGSFPEYQLDPLGFYLNVRREVGDFCRIRMTATRSITLLAHPEAVEHVLQRRQENYEKPPELKILFEGSLLTTGETEARAKRKLIQPPYSTSHSENACRIILDSTTQFLDRIFLSPDDPLDINAEMTRLTLQIASITLFDRDLSLPEDRVDDSFQECLRYMGNPGGKVMISARFPFSKRRRAFLGARLKLHALLGGIIRDHNNSDSPGGDILSQILARDTGSLLNPVENAFLLLLASYLTMSNVLQFAFRKLAEFPDIQNRAYEEIKETLRGSDPALEDVKHLSFVSAVFEESMRLFPNFHLFYHARKDDEISGYPISAGTRVCLSSYVTHRHPEFWNDPTKFDPERFLAADVLRHKFAYFPFGGGPRICLGKSFAMLEGPLILASVLRRCRVESVGSQSHGLLRFRQR